MKFKAVAGELAEITMSQMNDTVIDQNELRDQDVLMQIDTDFVPVITTQRVFKVPFKEQAEAYLSDG